MAEIIAQSRTLPASRNGRGQAAARVNSPRGALFGAIISGALLILCFPHADLGFLAWFALIPFLMTFPHARARLAFGRGFLCGLTFFCGLLYWIAVFTHHVIGALGYLAWLILSTRESLWVGLFAAGVNFVWGRTGTLGRLLAVPSLWTLCEWARQLGSLGLGWGDLGYTQWHALPLLQIAPLTGVWGISWLIVFVNTALATAKPKYLLLAGAVLGLTWLFGVARLREPLPRPTTVAAALQANIDENVPWFGRRPEDPAYYDKVLTTFDEMAREAHRQGATICVTAETSTPGYPRLDRNLRERLGTIASRNGVTLVIGAWDLDPATDGAVNAVFTVTPDGRLASRYAKQQLVPFGEYVPLHKYLPILEAFHVLINDDVPGGPSQPPLDGGPAGKIGAAVCYESTYPRFLREQVARGANYAVIVTDDTWYGRTAAARQHLAMSALRAAEARPVFDSRGRDRNLRRLRPEGPRDCRGDLFTAPSFPRLSRRVSGERSLCAMGIGSSASASLSPRCRFFDEASAAEIVGCALFQDQHFKTKHKDVTTSLRARFRPYSTKSWHEICWYNCRQSVSRAVPGPCCYRPFDCVPLPKQARKANRKSSLYNRSKEYSMRIQTSTASTITIALLFLAVFLPCAARASAPITTLHSFSGGNGDHPWTLVKGADGSFYGTSLGTGTTNGGTVFKVSSTGLLTVLYTFEPLGSTPPYANTHGAAPYASLLLGPDGNFYGATGSGGASGSGTIFKIAPDGYLTTLYTFAPLDSAGNNSHGAYPVSALVLGGDGQLYGSTAYGGTSGNGTVFKITSDGALTTLYTFEPLDSTNANSHGAFPNSPLLLGSDGNFYSVTRSGGTSGMGTVSR